MSRKLLGKIDFVEFGTIKDYPFLMGLQLGFALGNGCGVTCGGKYTINIDKNCRWEEPERQQVITANMEWIYQLLKDAKVNYVSQLLNKPVEVTIEENTFKDFRILTEVL